MIRILRPLAFCIAACLPLIAAQAAEFTPAQRAEIVQILRDALKQDPSILRDAVTAMQADDGDRQQVASRAALAAAKDTLIDAADPVGGNPRGDVTIVEFFDTRCPYCRRLEPTMAELLARDHGVRLVYKDLPILGPASVLGSKALLAAQKQGGYEKLRDAIMAAPPDTTKAMIQETAQKLGLDWKRLEHDMDDPAIATRIKANLVLAHAIGIEGTPALVIGGEMIPGAVDTAELTKAVATARGAK
ncbi:MAG TPA: DsbA family protein [Acetobacteraceae bacterium]|jgi:protein-disulfide isomerase|nr:DsbA family protein [Acetobacteraceae bacterium]